MRWLRWHDVTSLPPERRIDLVSAGFHAPGLVGELGAFAIGAAAMPKPSATVCFAPARNTAGAGNGEAPVTGGCGGEAAHPVEQLWRIGGDAGRRRKGTWVLGRGALITVSVVSMVGPWRT